MKSPSSPRRRAVCALACASALAAWGVLALPSAEAAEAMVVVGPTTRPAGGDAKADIKAEAKAKPAETRPAETKPVKAGEAEPAKPARRPPPESFLRVRRQQRDNSAGAYNGTKEAQAPYRLDALLQFRMVKGALEVETAVFPAGEQTRVKVEGSNATWIVFRQAQNFNPFILGGWNGANAVLPTNTQVTRVDHDVKDDEGVFSTYVNVNGDNCWIMGQSVIGQVTLNQSAGQINAAVTQYTSNPQNNAIQADALLNARATSLSQLRGEHPEEFRKYVLPLLAKVSDLQWMKPGAGDVYTVFDRVPADEQVTAKIRALLPDLDSDAFPVRDAASAQLAALGAPGALAALRMDWSQLSYEQSGRLLALVNAHRRREYVDPAVARRDPGFLADCLEYDDPAVRAAAKAALQRVLGQPVAFDPAAPAPARELAVDAVRKQIAQMPVEAPATQPAGKE